MVSAINPVSLTFVYEDEIKNHLANKSNWSYDYINEIGKRYMLRRKIEEKIPDEIPSEKIENDDLTEVDYDTVFHKIGYPDLGDFRELMNTLPEFEQVNEVEKFLDVYIDQISDKFT